MPGTNRRVFGPDIRDGNWWLFAYVGGQQSEWGPYATEAFANGARRALEQLFAEQDARLQHERDASASSRAETGEQPG